MENSTGGEGLPAPEELVEESEETALVYKPGETGDNYYPTITPEKRKEIIGRLAEFEMRLMELSELQQNYVLEYLRDPTNQTKAAERAGYSLTHAKVMASQNMRNAKVLAAIAAGQLLREDRTMVTADRTINELALIAFSDITDLEVIPRPGSITPEVRAREGRPEYVTRAVQSAEFKVTVTESEDAVNTTYHVKVKMWSKTDALRMLALYQRLIGGGGISDNDPSTRRRNGSDAGEPELFWEVGGKKIPLK